ncbi:helix-turn-helix domain-containing protein [Acinetobacter sp. CFCC 10889]|uniref:helix-turn-helix domain-containing protein n=1 Tax=Acinetobacter sp. CFCC 10889 TaxID=1775557 RepID=UPI000DD04161|nr:helix-turn-helix domain-containing protein [Acinetobacter sp. CFCC 10889]
MNSISFVRDEIIDTIQSNHGNAFEVAVSQVEKAVIEEVLILCRGNITEASKKLGIHRSTLRKKMEVRC